MALLDLFSKRQRRARGEVPDVYLYDDFPQALRIQIVHILREVIGPMTYSAGISDQICKQIHDGLAREYGLFHLTRKNEHVDAMLFDFFVNIANVEQAFDVVEYSFSTVAHNSRQLSYDQRRGNLVSVATAIAELNARFQEQAIGFRFESGQLMRIDSEIMHAEVVKPVLALLRDLKFGGVNEEFLSAHEHYRHGRFKECLVDSLKAFESTMKTICAERRWTFQTTDTAKALIHICFEKDLIPAFLQSEFSGLRSVLESGLPVVRNKQGGHGQGAQSVPVPSYVAQYALHMTASNILFLIEANKTYK